MHPLAIVLLICALAFVSVFLFFMYGYRILAKGGTAYREHIKARSVGQLDALYAEIDADRYFFISIISLFIFSILFLMIFKSLTGLLLGAPLGYLAPKFYLKILLKKRKKFLKRQLPDVIQMMANAMKAGNSLAQAVETVASETEAPAGQEFHYLLQRHQMGAGLQECFEELGTRLNDNDLSMIVTATAVSLQTGSNLAEMYERLATTIRQREAMQNKISSLTSQGKMQGLVVGLLPVILLLLLNVINPGIMGYFFNSFIGGFLLSVGLILEFLGIFFIRKIVRVDV